MLVLTRRVDETIKVGDDVTITVVRIDRDRVRIGIDADPSIPIHRLEVWREIQHDRERERRRV